jgi:hypothetical protein
MKTMIRFLLVILVILGAVAAKAALAADASMGKSKQQNLFVLKVDREFAGATVEVYYSNGDLVTSQKIEKRKMMIYFCDTRLGQYTIRVVKGEKKQEFQYIKK